VTVGERSSTPNLCSWERFVDSGARKIRLPSVRRRRDERALHEEGGGKPCVPGMQRSIYTGSGWRLVCYHDRHVDGHREQDQRCADEEPFNRYAGRWTGFGLLLGFAATTTPRVWPLLLLMLLLLPLVISRSKSGSSVRTMLIVVVSAACVSSIILLPPREQGRRCGCISPRGGNWGFGHSATQAVYYGALLVILGLDLSPALAQA
jgi:hypothetical protein